MFRQRLRGGHLADLPPGQIQLASPVMLLGLLAKAVTATGNRPRTLALPGGTRAVPVLGSSPGPALPPER
jgi:hypothetical protein